MKKLLIAAAAVSLASVLLASCSGKLTPDNTAKDKVGDAAATHSAEKVAEYFKDSISPNNVEKDITDIDQQLTPDTEGLTESVDESGKTSWSDSDGNIIYEQYTDDGSETLVYHTSSLDGRQLSVKYKNTDGVWSAYEFYCDDYTYTMDLDNLIFRITVNADAGTISYIKTADTQWTICKAVYTAEDGTHEYTYSVENGRVCENDVLIENS